MRTDTALDNLRAARKRAMTDVTKWHIISAAVSYAEDHPEWFADWSQCEFETEALGIASSEAADAGDIVASFALAAAAELAHPENDRAGLFGGAS